MADTMRIEHAMHDFGPSQKTIKAEQPRIDDKGSSGYTDYASPYQFGGAPHTPIHMHGSVANGTDTTRPSSYLAPRDLPPVPAHPHTVTGNYPYPSYGPVTQFGHNKPSVTTVNMPQNSRAGVEPYARFNAPSPTSHLVPSTYKPDHATAPKDPIALVWWFITEITKMSATRNAIYQAAHPNTPTRFTIPPVSYHEMDPAAERDRQREENRGRKQRWRKDNPDRNKDNDLRCRVNKLAKQKFGNAESAEKDRFIETEFNNRRAKRERRDAKNAAQPGHMHAFSTSEGTKQDLNTALQNSINPDVENAGYELMRMLIDVQPKAGAQQIPASSIANAKKWIDKIETGQANTEAMSSAMEIASQNKEFSHALWNHLIERNNYSLSYGSNSDGDEDQITNMTSRSSKPSFPVLNGGSRTFQQGPQDTAAIVSGLAQPKPYTSPYDRPESSTMSPTPTSTEVGKDKTPMRAAARPAARPATTSNKQDDNNPLSIDGFLELAAASLSDDDDNDDDTIAGSDAEMQDADALGQKAEEEARRRLAETTVNTIVPVSRAKDTSRMTSSTSDGPATRVKKRSTRKTKKKGKASGAAQIAHQEEQRKIKLYGYPPLPQWPEIS